MPAGAAVQTEDHTQGVALKLREPLQTVECGGAKLLEGRGSQLHFPLSPRSPKNPKVLRRHDRPFDQGRLADARLSKHNDRPAVAVPSRR